LTTDFCVDAVPEAITCYGPPEIFNTDHGCRFTNQEFTGLLQTHGIQISMDGAGRWRANGFVERLWRSLKYEEVSLSADETVRDTQDGIARYMTFYNQIRPHRARDGRMPDACTVTTGLYGPPPPRYQRPGITYERKDAVQTSRATSVIFTDGELR
jgi:putative transposase